jgi:hypothetical protein
LVWIVERSDDGAGWAVRSVDGKQLGTRRLKKEAVEPVPGNGRGFEVVA